MRDSSTRSRDDVSVSWLFSRAVCQVLRCITFTSTQLPGPSYHCRAGEPTAKRPWPDHWTGHVVIDVKRQMAKSCGDLIFSSHTTFMLTGTRSAAVTLRGQCCLGQRALHGVQAH